MVRIQTLHIEFDTLKIEDSEFIEDYFNQIVSIINQLKVNGEKIEDQRIIEKIL